jgi:hypothetical protein
VKFIICTPTKYYYGWQIEDIEMRGMRNPYKILVSKFKVKGALGTFHVNGKTILKEVLKKYICISKLCRQILTWLIAKSV